METSFKKYIFVLTTHLIVGFLGYSYRQVSDTIFQRWSSAQFNFGYSEFINNNTILPFYEELPTTVRDVRSPLYLIQLAKLERFIFFLLTQVEELDSAYLHPKLLQEIQMYGTHNT